MQQFCDIFDKKGDAWHMILRDNPVGHGFVLKDLVLIELFQIYKSWLCDRLHTADKIFVKNYLKPIRDTFFSNMWNFPIPDIFI